VRAFPADGFCVFEAVCDEAETIRLRDWVSLELSQDIGRGGIRNLLDFPEMRALAESSAIRGVVDQVLGPAARPVRGILFDKTSDANWKVPWHQDVTIAVAERVEAEGYGPWSSKAGVLHVQPPAEALERMVSVRLHLDDCPAENGALKVIAGSHRWGKIPEARIASVVAEGREVIAEVKAGGVLLMRPLLVHSSSAAVRPGHRRVVHFDYAAGELADGLRWAVDEAVKAEGPANVSHD
jgi:hypothetical protein